MLGVNIPTQSSIDPTNYDKIQIEFPPFVTLPTDTLFQQVKLCNRVITKERYTFPLVMVIAENYAAGTGLTFPLELDHNNRCHRNEVFISVKCMSTMRHKITMLCYVRRSVHY